MLPIMVGAGAGSAILGAAGSYNKDIAAANNAAYQAQVAKNNAAIARQNAELETQTGEITAANYGMKTRAAVGKTLAEQGASGVDVNTGSSVDVRSAESKLGLLDALTIRANAARKSYGYQVAATGAEAESGLLTSEAQQAREAAPYSALGSFLGSVSSVGKNFAMGGFGGSFGKGE